MADIPGARIMSVTEIGTSDGDELAYVRCGLHDGSLSALSFSSDISNPLCLAFLSAAGHLQKKRSMRGLPNDGMLIDIHSAKMALAKTPEGRAVVVFDLLTKSEAELSFRLDLALAHEVAKKLTGLLTNESQR